MNKVFCNRETNMVEQIINIDVDTRFDENWYPWCYVIDDKNNEINSYNLRYNLETQKFEINEDFIEIETIVEKSESQKEIEELQGELELTQNALNEILMSMTGGDI